MVPEPSRELIDSVREQNMSNIEHIIIDGGSTDGTVDIIKKNEKDIAFWISEKDSGIYDAMNKGIINSRGEWVLFINSDDFIYEGILSEIFENEQNLGKFDLFYGSMIYNGGSYKIKINRRNLHNLNSPLSYSHPATFFKKNFIEKFNGYNAGFRVVGDYDLLVRIAKSGYKSLFIDKAISVMSSGGVSDRIRSIPCIIRERFIIDKSNFNCVTAYRNLFLHVLPIYLKQIIKKILLRTGFKKVVNLYFKKKYQYR